MAYGGFKDLPRRAASDKILRDRAFEIAKSPKCDGYQCKPTSVAFNLLSIKILLANLTLI